MLRSTPDKQQYLKDLLRPPGTGFRSEGTQWLSAAQDYVVLLVESEVQILCAMNGARPFRIREMVAQVDNSFKLQDMPNADERPAR